VGATRERERDFSGTSAGEDWGAARERDFSGAGAGEDWGHCGVGAKEKIRRRGEENKNRKTNLAFARAERSVRRPTDQGSALALGLHPHAAQQLVLPWFYPSRSHTARLSPDFFSRFLPSFFQQNLGALV
jgi:hypothetical protein